jgi:hypothetical protein
MDLLQSGEVRLVVNTPTPQSAMPIETRFGVG